MEGAKRDAAISTLPFHIQNRHTYNFMKLSAGWILLPASKENGGDVWGTNPPAASISSPTISVTSRSNLDCIPPIKY